jgi:hypothetical protein
MKKILKYVLLRFIFTTIRNNHNVFPYLSAGVLTYIYFR